MPHMHKPWDVIQYRLDLYLQIQLCIYDYKMEKYDCKVMQPKFQSTSSICCLSVEELVSRLRSSPVYSNIIMVCFLTIDSLCRGASIDAAYFFNIPKNVQNVILGGWTLAQL